MSLQAEENTEIAIKVMGWRWMRLFGIPIKGTPNYPEKQNVRQLMSLEQLANTDWQTMFTGDADGTEPLSYTYCSSGCNAAFVPQYNESCEAAEQVEDRIEALGLMSQFTANLDRVRRTPKEAKRPYRVSPRMIAKAALMTVETK